MYMYIVFYLVTDNKAKSHSTDYSAGKYTLGTRSFIS